MAKRICLIEGCTNEIGERSKCDTCVNCRKYLGRWGNRDYSEVLERQHNLSLYQSRLEAVSPKRRRATVARPTRQAEAAARH